MFSPDGKVRLCAANAPGIFHDGTISDYEIYEGMKKIYEAMGAKLNEWEMQMIGGSFPRLK